MTVQASLPNLAFLLLTKIFDLIVQKKNKKKPKALRTFPRCFQELGQNHFVSISL